jgi:exodeoxyribonuclease VII small subunit
MAPKKSATTAPAGYAEAMREVEQILSELDSNSVDVDVLATKVERASFLITWCNERIAAAQLSIDTLVASIDVADVSDDDYDDDEFEDDDE